MLDVDGKCVYEDLDIFFLEFVFIFFGGNVDLVVSKLLLFNDRFVDIVIMRIFVMMGKDFVCLEENYFYDGLEVVREKCVNGGESFIKLVDVGCFLVRES